MENFNQKAQLIWNIADILRGGWKQHEYQDVILPLVVLKRLDAVLAPSKPKVLEQYHAYKGKVDPDPILKKVTGVGFYNTSSYDFVKLLDEPKQIVKNLNSYINGFSQNIQDIFAKFDFGRQLERLEGGNIMYEIIKVLNKVDLDPKLVDNHQMGSIFEELLRRFSEMSNETAGEHYTPRDVVKLMAELMITPDIKALNKPHLITRVYDCCCGTGGMLSVTKDLISEKTGKKEDIYLFGQELNAVSYAMCKGDMLIKGENPENIKGGEKDHSKASTLSNDQFYGESFDYLISNPPYGTDWKKDKEAVDREAARGYAGRFGAGIPRISDGQLLFLEHMISKMRLKKDGGARIAIIFNGSPLFTGDAGSGESEIRRWILERDLLEAIVALPDQLFYNTGINTYIWLLTNKKDDKKKDKIQLIDARTFFDKRRKSLGNKRNDISDDGRRRILDLYLGFKQSEFSKIFTSMDFAYRQITVERPLRLKIVIDTEHIDRFKATKVFIKDKKAGEACVTALQTISKKEFLDLAKFEKAFSEAVKNHKKIPATLKKSLIDSLGERDEKAEIVKDENGAIVADSELRDTENVPLKQSIKSYFDREVKPYVSDSWVNESVRDEKDGQVGKVGYEIPFTRFFYKYQPPRELGEIEKDIEKVENELLTLLKQL